MALGVLLEGGGVGHRRGDDLSIRACARSRCGRRTGVGWAEDVPAAKLYVIPGSHPCRTGMLLLEHKGIPYERVEFVPGIHRSPCGCSASRPRRSAPTSSARAATGGSRWRTVSAPCRPCATTASKVQTCRAIARFLDEVQPDPPLFPADPERRRAVEEAELWGDDVLQMPARRLTFAARCGGRARSATTGRTAGSACCCSSGAGCGPAPRRRSDAASSRSTRPPSARCSTRFRGQLDHVDALIEQGVLNGEQLNAADYMIVTSLALLTYRTDLEPEIMARPAGALVDRVLPEPARAARERRPRRWLAAVRPPRIITTETAMIQIAATRKASGAKAPPAAKNPLLAKIRHRADELNHADRVPGRDGPAREPAVRRAAAAAAKKNTATGNAGHREDLGRRCRASARLSTSSPSPATSNAARRRSRYRSG